MKKVLLVGLGLVIGVLGYITFDAVLTPDAAIIEAVEGEVLYSGDFMDADAVHTASGSFTIVGDGMGGRKIMLSNDFTMSNAPDAHIKINGMLIAKNKFKGGQVYPIPNLIGEDITDVQVWCKIADVSLAKSSLMMGEAMPMSTDEGMSMDMEMMLERTEGLVILGTTGNPKPFAMEQGGEYKGKVSGAFTAAIGEALSMEEMDMNAGYFGYAPEIAIVDGKTYRMVAPAIVKDNFVVSDGMHWTRYDLGVDEGTNMITKVSEGTIMK